ncbi:MAG: SMK killer toxin resistance protein [Claussenomyces sp. TS43310]|nr:MAG: SMK killer toxin resistance protein [Claussenomyces sp. TS43310]
MATFITDLISSIFVPGPTRSLVVATNASFACLQLVLFCLLTATYSIHFVVLSVLCAALWWSINWFVGELHAFKAAEEAKKQEQESGRQNVGGSDTEAETIVEAETKVGAGGSGSKEVEVTEKLGELRDRGAGGSGGSRSEPSTEDEWEKVSENEKDK